MYNISNIASPKSFPAKQGLRVTQGAAVLCCTSGEKALQTATGAALSCVTWSLDHVRCIVSSNPCMRNHTLQCLIAHAGIAADNVPELNKIDVYN